ncbi:hypothetical protein GE09DRAFT_1294435 [Coniochaeta sp. 2T2.1]|nr:hypothetical protein GE09DRAFT_1294435 [Coniochaeta sp. 2T2.1]
MPSVKNQSPAFALLDAFVERGGNFIHTDYSKRRAADYLADWMVERRNREKIVLSVGFSEGWSVATRHMRRDPLPGGENEVLYINSFFHIQLQKLRTHYIDIYIVPKWWDDDGSIQTQWLLRALTDLHLANKVRYTGVAHVPAYSVAATNAAARQAGLIPFSVYRGAWNYDTTRPEQSNPPERDLHHIEWLRRRYAKVDTGDELRKLIARRPASERVPGVDITQQMMIVAIVRHMEGYPYVFPALTVEYAEGWDTANVSLGINVTAEERARFDAVTKFDRGYPSNVVKEPSPMAASGGGPSTVGH